jgi:hypothetical protein
VAGFGNWATLGGGGDPVTGLGSTFPSLGSLFGGSGGGGGGGTASNYYQDAAADYGARQTASDRDRAFSNDPYGAAATDYGMRQNAASSGASDVQHPRPGGTALENAALGNVGSWGAVPDLTQLWPSDGSVNMDLLGSFNSQHPEFGGLGWNANDASGGAFLGGGAANGGGMSGGGMDPGSLMGMFGGADSAARSAE